MPSDLDIYRSAKLLIGQHGEDVLEMIETEQQRTFEKVQARHGATSSS